MNIPNTERVSRKVVAQALGISERHVTRLTREKVFRQPVKGKYDLFDCSRRYVKHVAQGGATTELVSHRQDFERERARRLRMENDVREGTLLPNDIVERAFTQSMALVVQHLRAVPGRCAQELANMDNPGVIRHRLLEEINHARRAGVAALADYVERRGWWHDDDGEQEKAR